MAQARPLPAMCRWMHFLASWRSQNEDKHWHLQGQLQQLQGILYVMPGAVAGK